MATTHSTFFTGSDFTTVTVESIVASGFCGLQIFGIPSEGARAMRERIRCAFETMDLPLPAQRILVHIFPVITNRMLKSPLEQLDFAVFAAVFLAFLEKKKNLFKPFLQGPLQVLFLSKKNNPYFWGELSLRGKINPWSGGVFLARGDHDHFLAREGAVQSVDGNGENTWQVGSVSQWCKGPWVPLKTHSYRKEHCAAQMQRMCRIKETVCDLRQRPSLLLAMCLAAVARLHLICMGPPGVGKTHGLSRIGGLLPPLSAQERQQLQICAHRSDRCAVEQGFRPIRRPHHSVSLSGMVGSAQLNPGELTWAHGGVLFLDELAEFQRHVLEALREPLDCHRVHLSRSAGDVHFPARVLLIAATNPCPCGHWGGRFQPCRCKPLHLQAYAQKLSGPILGRIALQVWLGAPDHHAPWDRDAQNPIQSCFSSCIQNEEAFAKHFINVQDNLWFSSGDLNHIPPYLSHLPLRSAGHVVRIMETLKALLRWDKSESHLLNAALSYQNMEKLYIL